MRAYITALHCSSNAIKLLVDELWWIYMLKEAVLAVLIRSLCRCCIYLFRGATLWMPLWSSNVVSLGGVQRVSYVSCLFPQKNAVWRWMMDHLSCMNSPPNVATALPHANFVYQVILQDIDFIQVTFIRLYMRLSTSWWILLGGLCSRIATIKSP